MKTSITFLTLTLFAAIPAFASPAVSYSCVGKNKVNGEAVTFNLVFSDYGREEGYTNEAITILKKSWEDRSAPAIVLQMHGATPQNDCQKNEQGETYMNGPFSMDPTEEGNLAAYKISFQTGCLADRKLDVQAYCFFDN